MIEYGKKFVNIIIGLILNQSKLVLHVGSIYEYIIFVIIIHSFIKNQNDLNEIYNF